MRVTGSTLYLLKQLFYILQYFAPDKEPEQGLCEMFTPPPRWVGGWVCE